MCMAGLAPAPPRFGNHVLQSTSQGTKDSRFLLASRHAGGMPGRVLVSATPDLCLGTASSPWLRFHTCILNDHRLGMSTLLPHPSCVVHPTLQPVPHSERTCVVSRRHWLPA